VTPSITTIATLTEVAEERKRQDQKWGRPYQNPLTRLAILTEEVGEYAKEVVDAKFKCDNNIVYTVELANMRAELVQIAAVAVASIECMDRAQWDWEDTNGIK
jgi:NTP pyrophosphatase (non-canonical NTP hydrolase)